MKITIATGPIFPVPAVRGGAVPRLWEGLAREFAKRGHEVTVFAREFAGQASNETVDGIRYVRRGGYGQSTSIKRDLVQCLLYALKTARYVPSGDVVVTNDFWTPAVLPWIKPSAGKIVVNANRFPKGQYWLYPKCAAFAAVSGAVAKAVKEQTPSAANKVVVVPNAIDEVFLEETKRARAEPSRQREAEPRANEETKGLRDQGTKRPQDYVTTERQDGSKAVRILYVGRIHPEKGLGLLADALRLLASEDQKRKSPKEKEATWECVFVGPVDQNEGGGGEAFGEELRRKLTGLPVRFEKPVYDTVALAKVYDDADVFVYPSLAETGESFGIAPLEAMARDLVPVVSRLEVFREYLEPGVNGMVFDHRSPAASENLAAALRALIEDASARRGLGEAARATAERFSPAVIADKYLQLFEKVVSGR